MSTDFTIKVLGSGTSVGVPTIGCNCQVCTSKDPHDCRLRPSVLISYQEKGTLRNILVDTSPDFRQQALNTGFSSLDGVFYTHDHADHIMGLDDIRPFNYGKQERIPIYASRSTLNSLKRVFPYGFTGESAHSGGVPRLETHEINTEPINLFGLEFQPFRVHHGPKNILGFRFGKAAYVTDQTGFPDESMPRLQDLEVLFLGALRHLPHPMHSTVEEALAWVELLKPTRAYFTHISHDLSHQRTSEALPPGVWLAYDGLSIPVKG